MAQFYNYKEKKSYKEIDFVCKSCNWQGIGEQAKVGMASSSGFPVLCPKCDGYIEWIDSTVSIDELLQYGSEKDKTNARKRQDFLNRVWAAELKNCEQLPDIEANEIIFTLHEEESAGDADSHIILCYGGIEIWREVRSFEYYSRYLQLGELLKEKYGNRLVDFIPEYTVHLGGDYLSAFDKVTAFRKALSNTIDMSDDEFEFVTQSGCFSKNKAICWKALDFAKERHAGQTRNEGTPYFTHIEGVIDALRKGGKVLDHLFTIAALHDILEDTETTKDELYALLCSYPDEKTIAHFASLYKCDRSQGAEIYDRLNNQGCRDVIAEVELLTRKSEDTFRVYIDRIFQDDSIKREKYQYNGAKFVKLADRLHNLSTLHLCGDTKKIQREIRQTEKYFMPWRKKHRDCEALFALIEKELELVKWRLKGIQHENELLAEKEALPHKIISLIKIEKRIDTSGAEYSVITNEGEVGKLAGRLHWFMLRDAKKNYDSPKYTSTEEATLIVESRNGLAYEFYAFTGYRFGGSEGEYTDKLRISCSEISLDALLFSEIETLR